MLEAGGGGRVLKLAPIRPCPAAKLTSSTIEWEPAIHTRPAARGATLPVSMPIPLRIASPPRALSTIGTGSPAPVKAGSFSGGVITVVEGLKPMSTLSGRRCSVALMR